MFVKHVSQTIFVYLLLYVDDILVASRDKHEIDRIKTDLGKEFEMRDLRLAKKILGMSIDRDIKIKNYFCLNSHILKKCCGDLICRNVSPWTQL